MAGFDIDRVAHLARLDLTDEERATFGAQLETIVAYVDRIAGLDVEGLAPTLHGHNVNNIFREDAPVEGLETEVVLANAPARIDNEIRMPRVVE
ncbi:MAG: Asp-tRNA(Asn)/Glu-tRNA(Gln) amidotransferase subunit GatC [bacterium]|nr:Asp-tRNA(Asn)/Glu-tRNA(Gln) amidotransferase subunit GatC [bacterium]MDO5463022.1 Asp-tRNA(Asn)/Glu-tRNA(Gln) amidotransferase subunit GatC [bacterium]